MKKKKAYLATETKFQNGNYYTIVVISAVVEGERTCILSFDKLFTDKAQAMEFMDSNLAMNILRAVQEG